MNGKLVGSDFSVGSNVVYVCNAEFTLRGDRTRQCQSGGAWSGSLPTCERESQSIIVRLSPSLCVSVHHCASQSIIVRLRPSLCVSDHHCASQTIIVHLRPSLCVISETRSIAIEASGAASGLSNHMFFWK